MKTVKIILVILSVIITGGLILLYLYNRKHSAKKNIEHMEQNTKVFKKYPQTRGYLNNNPFNIRSTSIDWKGELPISQRTDSEFEQFDTLENGIRAGLINLKSHIKLSKGNLKDLIHAYAPPSENDTESYYKHLKTFNLPDRVNETNLLTLAVAITSMENGKALEIADINKQLEKLV